MFRKFLIKDNQGNPSVTTTAFVLGFLVVNVKLLLSGVHLTDMAQMADFTGVEYGAALAALGGVYILKRNQDSKDV